MRSRHSSRIQIRRRGLILPRPESVMSGLQEFAFKHALTRDVAYGSLPHAERRDLHRRVAEWIQRVAPDRDVESRQLAAYHYREAISNEYGEDDPEVVRRAFDLLLATGQSALHRGAFIAARTQFEHAAALSAGDDRYASAVLALAELDAMEARWACAPRRLDLIEELVADSDARMRSATLALRSRVCWLGGSWEEAFAAANGAVSALAGLPESDQLARALARRSQIEMLKNRPEAVEHSIEAIAVADRVGDNFAAVNARINLFTARAGAGVGPNVQKGPRHRQCRDGGGGARRGVPDDRQLGLVVRHGHLSVDEIESVATTARAGKLPPPPSIAAYLELSLAGILFVPAGRWAEAQAIIDGVDGPGLNASSALVWRTTVGGLALRRGDLAGAEETLGELRELAVASGEPQRIIPMACVVLPWLHVSGEHDELREVARETLDAMEGQWPASIALDGIVRTLAAAEELELLADITESVKRLSAGVEAGSRALSLIAAEGLNALAADRADEAVSHLSAATARQDALGLAYDSACLKLDLARALDRAGSPAEAR